VNEWCEVNENSFAIIHIDMQKFKVPVIVIVVVLLLFAVYFFLLSSSIYDGVPKSAIAVIEVKDWNQFASKLNTTSAGSEFKKTDAAQKLLSQIELIQELLSSDKSLEKEIGSGKTLASVHVTSAIDYDFLFTTDLNGVNDNTILNRIQSSSKTRTVKVRIFKNNKVIDVFLRDGKQLCFAKLKDILVFSFTPFLTENAMSAIQSGENLGSDKVFKSIRTKLSASADVNLYFNFQKAAIIFPLAFKAENVCLLNDVAKYGNWGHYEVSFTNEKMKMDGSIATSVEAQQQTENIISANLQAYLTDNVAYVQISKVDTTQLSSPLLSYFINWMGEAKAFAILEPLKEDFTEQNVFVISSKDQQKAIKDLKQLISDNGEQAVAVDTFLNSEIYSLSDGSVINELFGSSLVLFRTCFFSVQKDAVLFCKNLDALKLLLEKVNKGETLDKDKNFAATNYSLFGLNSSIQYLNFQRGGLLLQGLLQPNSSLQIFVTSFKNVLAVSNNSGKKTSSHLTFSNSGENANSTGLVWKTKLQTTATNTPQIILNTVLNENEIFIQDTANNIYLISTSGEILFTKNINEPILGKVTSLDYYNNGKQQYIFNSAHHVFIIDRLGNDVASYPLRLSSTANCGMTLSKNRYYIPCINGSVYGYELTGRPLSGWSPKLGLGIISKPLQIISGTKSDFVLCFNNSGKLILLDTKGNPKWSVDNLPATKQNFSLIQLTDNFKLLNAYANQLTEISADGNDNIKPLIDSVTSFAVIQTSDSTYNYCFSSNNQIRDYNNKDEFQFGVSLNASTITSIETASLNGVKYLMVLDDSSKQIFVYDSSLKPTASFNYNGNNSFVISDLFNRKTFCAITIDTTGNISCHRIK